MNIPCLPTISATCSDVGTLTHCVMFCDFLDDPESGESGDSSKRPFGGSGLAVLYVVLFRLSIESSSAASRARFSIMVDILSKKFNINSAGCSTTVHNGSAVIWSANVQTSALAVRLVAIFLPLAIKADARLLQNTSGC